MLHALFLGAGGTTSSCNSATDVRCERLNIGFIAAGGTGSLHLSQS